MTQLVRKAVFPVAGLGTRFLPVTKANPKEMLPIVNKPLIQYAVEEAIAAGITQLVFVTSYSKRAIEDHFDTDHELEQLLIAKGKDELLVTLRDILPDGVSCVYVRQPRPLGLGHAVLCAKPVVGDEPFAVLLADDLMVEQQSSRCLVAMIEQYHTHGTSVLAVEEVADADVGKYGIVALNSEDTDKMCAIVEKPTLAAAPSRFGVVGRYILTPTIFSLLENTMAGEGNELQLTDAIAGLLKRESVHIHQLVGKRYDCGSCLGYLQATIAVAMQDPVTAQAVQDFMRANHW